MTARVLASTVALLLVASCGARPARWDGLQARDQLFLAGVVERYERGDLRGAVVELNRLLTLRPQDAQLHFMLGNALYRSGDLKAAAAAYGNALNLRPNDIEARVSRGFALYELGNCTGSHAEWAAAAELNPTEPMAHATLAVGLHCVGDHAAAVTEYSRAIQLDKRYASPDRLRIDIRWKAQAITTLEELNRSIVYLNDKSSR